MTEVKTEIMVESADSDVSYEMKLAKTVADHLHKHYPGHLWAVNVNTRGGTVNIYNLALSSLWGYVLYLTTIQNDPKFISVMRAGGELIERANLKAKWDQTMPTTIDGMPDKYQPGKRMKLN